MIDRLLTEGQPELAVVATWAVSQRCVDPTRLDAWIAQATTAGSVREVLAAKPRAAKRRGGAAARPAQRA